MSRTYGMILVLLLIIAGLWYLATPHKMIAPTKQATRQTMISPSPSSATIRISSGTNPDIPLTLTSGFTIHVFAKNLGSPRDLQMTPGGTLLVSDPIDNKVYALPDTNHDGVADTAKIIIANEPHVHGLAFYNNQLFIADTTRIVRYNWDESTLTATKDKVLFTLPANNDHNARTIAFSNSGQMYVALGSTCNACKEDPTTGGSVLVSDAQGSSPHVFATGLRDAAFLSINPETKEIWATEMGRDYLGDNVPPDEIDIVRKGQDYGWPYCYGDKVHDGNFDPDNMHSCSNTVSPIYSIPAHSAPLGLTFINSPQFPASWQGDLLVAYHGSWNRTKPVGYKIVHLTVHGNSIIGSEDFLTGFAPSSTPNVPGNSKNAAKERPVDMTFDKAGNLYVSDDKEGNVFIVQKK